MLTFDIDFFFKGGDTLLRVTTETQHRHGLNQAMVDKLVIDEMWEFLSKIMTERARKDASLSGTSSLSHAEGAPKAALKRKPSTSVEPSPLVVQYKSFLKKKAEGLGGRLPTVDENRQFYKEFQDHMRSVNAAKKKKALEDKDWNPKKKIDRKKSGTGERGHKILIRFIGFSEITKSGAARHRVVKRCESA